MPFGGDYPSAGFVEESLVERMNGKIAELQTVLQANTRQKTQGSFALEGMAHADLNVQSRTNKNGGHA